MGDGFVNDKGVEPEFHFTRSELRQAILQGCWIGFAMGIVGGIGIGASLGIWIVRLP